MNKAHNRNLKSFTLLEVIITMVISGVLITASYKCYHILEALSHLKNKEMACEKEAFVFYNTFSGDFKKANSVSGDATLLSMSEPDGKVIRYALEETIVIRSLLDQSDTFQVVAADVKLQKEEITGFYQQATMEIESCHESYEVCITKHYPNDVLMNQELLNSKK